MNTVLVVNKTGRDLEVAEPKIVAAVQSHLEGKGKTDASVEVEVVGEAEITRLNEERLHHKGATDVLSFPLDQVPGEENPLIGTIVIFGDIIKTRVNSNNFENEFLFLVNHGLDHLLGTHHEE